MTEVFLLLSFVGLLVVGGIFVEDDIG